MAQGYRVQLRAMQLESQDMEQVTQSNHSARGAGLAHPGTISCQG